MAPAVADLVRLIVELEERKINFESLTEKIETRSPAGRLVFYVFAALAISLPLEDADRELLASVLMNRQEELTPELLEGVLNSLRKRASQACSRGTTTAG
jgi:hypothetical protein